MLRGRRRGTGFKHGMAALMALAVTAIAPAAAHAAAQPTIDDGPAEGSLSTSRSASFTFHGNDLIIPSTFECSIDDGAYVACTSPVTYNALTDGDHAFRVRAVGGLLGERSASSTRSWRIDASTPDTALGSRPNAVTNVRTAQFTFTSSESGGGFVCRLDAGAVVPCSSPVTFTSLADGSHTFEVSARDAAGNTDASPATHTWVIDGSDPDTVIEGGPPTETADTSATFSFSSTESGASLQCSLDDAPFTACISPLTLGPLATGVHGFRVRAVDAAGNADPTPAEYSWLITGSGTGGGGGGGGGTGGGGTGGGGTGGGGTGGGGGAPKPIADDAKAPTVSIAGPRAGSKFAQRKIVKKRVKRKGKRRTIRVTQKRQLVIKGSAADPNGVRTVELALRLVRAVPCAWFDGKRHFVARACSEPVWFPVTVNDTSWSFTVRKGVRLPRGTYEVRARATDGTGRTSSLFSSATKTLLRFKVTS